MEFINTILRLVQLLWTLLITALIGNAIANYASTSGSGKSAINFTIFVAVLSWIAALYGLIASFVTSLAMPIVLLALDGLAVLFTFISAVVLAAKLGAVNCSNLSGKGSDYIAFGSTNGDQKQCREIQASDVFMWFLFICYIATLFFAFKAFRGSGMSARRGPSMSQVGV
ncbi:putative MARVEL domain-containing protein [Seiridium unicorne]|uniref:MARVEL domain-containing protein n=1 Tax=Seiridium unicorne TaxID=138068 RepID=A0ABR2VGQ7_9PEZI